MKQQASKIYTFLMYFIQHYLLNAVVIWKYVICNRLVDEQY